MKTNKLVDAVTGQSATALKVDRSTHSRTHIVSKDPADILRVVEAMASSPFFSASLERVGRVYHSFIYASSEPLS
jgi:hypothetical protein